MISFALVICDVFLIYGAVANGAYGLDYSQ